jgi:hypothetical protein
VILKSCTLSRKSDTTETRNPCVIKVILLACFTYSYTEPVFTKHQIFFYSSICTPCLSKNPKYTFYAIKSSLTLTLYETGTAIPEVLYPLSDVRYHWNPEPVCNKSHFASLFYLYWYFLIYSISSDMLTIIFVLFSLVLFCCVCCIDDCSMFGLEINKIIIIIINMKPARPWMLAHLKIIWQFHAHLVHQKVSRFLGTTFFRAESSLIQSSCTLTHSTNEDLLNIKCKGDPEVLCPLSYVRYHWNPEPVSACVIKVILLACFTYIDIF